MNEETNPQTGSAVVGAVLGVCTIVGAYHVSKFVGRNTVKGAVKIAKKPFTRRKK